MKVARCVSDAHARSAVCTGTLDRTHLRFFTEKTAVGLMTRDGLTVQDLRRAYQGSIGFRLTSKRLRWYTTRMLRLIMPKNLLTYQYLIRSVVG